MNLSRLFHCSVIKVLCRFLSHATAFICYQNCLRLSRTFLIHDNRKFAEHIFYYIFFTVRQICLPVARDSLYIISSGSTVVNNFFHFFQTPFSDHFTVPLQSCPDHTIHTHKTREKKCSLLSRVLYFSVFTQISCFTIFLLMLQFLQ